MGSFGNDETIKANWWHIVCFQRKPLYPDVQIAAGLQNNFLVSSSLKVQSPERKQNYEYYLKNVHAYGLSGVFFNLTFNQHVCRVWVIPCTEKRTEAQFT